MTAYWIVKLLFVYSSLCVWCELCCPLVAKAHTPVWAQCQWAVKHEIMIEIFFWGGGVRLWLYIFINRPQSANFLLKKHLTFFFRCLCGAGMDSCHVIPVLVLGECRVCICATWTCTKVALKKKKNHKSFIFMGNAVKWVQNDIKLGFFRYRQS